MEHPTHGNGSSSALAEPAAGRVFAGRYRVLRALKQGNGIETLLGTDLFDKTAVVLKTASSESLSVGAQMRLEHEASVLRQIRGRGVTPLLHFGRENGTLYLV